MPLLPSDLQIRRTSAELDAFVEKVRLHVRTNRTEFEAGMNKRGLYKEFLNEVQPLCAFASATYPADFTVQPIIGNQGYDAIVFDSTGQEYEKLEFARPHDGASAANAARQVVSRGHSDAEITDYRDPLGSFIPYMRTTAKAKSQNDYGGITLVFILAAPPPLAGTESIYSNQIIEIKNIIEENSFKASKVLLFIPPNQILKLKLTTH